MLDTLTWIATTAFWLAITFLAFQHILGPILVWRNERIPAAYNLAPLDPQTVITQLDLAGAIAVEQLAALGFIPIAASEIVKSNSRTAIVLLRHATDPAAANITLAENAIQKFSFVEFTQIFTGGMMLDVNTSPMQGTFPEFADKRVLRFPGMSVPELHAAFVKLREGLVHAHTPLTALSTDAPLAELSRRLDEETVKLIRLGYVAHMPENGVHRLTAKGAVLFTWKHLWPWKRLRNRAELAASRRALNEA